MRETSFWSELISRTLTIYASLIFVVLWVGFVIALVVNREWLDEIWSWAQALPSPLMIIIWVLFLPVMVGLWIWESSLPPLGCLVGFTGMVAWTLLAVYSLFKYFR